MRSHIEFYGKCRRTDLSVAAGHHRGALPRRRPDRHACTGSLRRECGLHLVKPIIIENVLQVSAATIGVGKAARAAPDGYTL